jgi:hypothetical protein
MFLDLYIQIPYPVSTRSAPLFGRHQQKFRESIRSSGIEFASSKPELESTMRALAASAGKAAVAFEHVSVAELSPTGKVAAHWGMERTREFSLIDGND